MRHYIFTIILFAVSLIAPSCSNDDGPFSNNAQLYDIVTYDGNDASGACFSFRRRDDSPLITLTAPGVSVSSSIKPSDRVILGYYPTSGEPYSSGDISIISINKINQDTLHYHNATDLNGWDNDAVFLNSVWRSGKYLNVYMRVEYSNNARIFKIAADSATIQDPKPHLYLMHDMGDAPTSFTRRAYLSVDISSLWEKNYCEGIILHVNDTNLKTDTYTFLKSGVSQ